jgi:uncharacterized protein (TIGR03545 family)
MRASIGWRDVLPWSLGLLGLVVFVHLAIAWAIRSEVVLSGQRCVGARVEVGDTRVSLVGSSVSLRKICIANPLSPLRNLIEIDRCDLELDPGALLHKQAIIRDGAVTGLQFDTPRDTNGVLPGVDFAAAEPQTFWLDEAATKTAHDWLDRLNEKFDRYPIDQLESIRLTEELLQNWPQQSAELASQASALRQRTIDLRAGVREARKNPLRHVDFLDQVPAQVETIRAEVASLSQAVENLPNVADADRRAIVAAREHDEKLLRDEFQFEPIDANVLSAYLLQERMSGPVAELLGWFHWIRRIVPADGKQIDQPIAANRRGHDILFTGCQFSPNLFIRTLHLEGSTRLAGQPIEFFGTLSDVTDRPARHVQPMRLKLQTRGTLPLALQATIDRTGPVARDELQVEYGDLVLPKLRLGSSDKLRLSLAATAATLKLVVTLDGEKLSGDVQLVQKQVEIKPSLTGELARLHVDTELERSLGKLHSVSTRISLSGTLDEPECRLQSNLGPAVAEAMDRALARTASKYSREVLAQSRERVNRRLAEFDRQLADTQDELHPHLADSTTALDQLTSGTDPGRRLTVEHLGRRLPADSLFR